jgi:rhamnose utilization protein RhaD (predicted bifunctional aldolase and dehydrogenase)
MPHRVVLHLHAVEILAYLVRKDPFAALHRLIDNRIDAVFLAYFTPGASLAGAVAEELKAHPSAEVVFLKSHGVVIGGEDVDSVDRTLRTLLSLLEVEQGTSSSDSEEIRNEEVAMRNCFVRCKDERLNELATNSQFWGRLRDDWALYPDHVVFLGDRALMIESFDYLERLAELPERPPFAFLKGQGVFEGEVTTDAHRAQLRCYYEVLLRQPPHQKLSSLTDSQTAELLNWDAEKYRQRIVPIK